MYIMSLNSTKVTINQSNLFYVFVWGKHYFPLAYVIKSSNCSFRIKKDTNTCKRQESNFFGRIVFVFFLFACTVRVF